MEGTFKGLALLGASALAVFAVWAILEKGAFISHLGSPPPEQFQPPLPDHPRAGFNPEPRQIPPPRTIQPPPARGTATIYKWIDEKGGVHFSDRPQSAQSEAIAVGKVQTVSMVGTKSRPAGSLGTLPYATGTPPGGHRERRISAEDYHFISYASQRGDYVVFSGRVEFGPSCNQLQLLVQGKSNHGQSVTGRTVVENAGSVSKLWETKRWVGMDRRGTLPVWEVVGIRADCLD